MWKEQVIALIMLVISLLKRTCMYTSPPTLVFQPEPPARSFSTAGS